MRTHTSPISRKTPYAALTAIACVFGLLYVAGDAVGSWTLSNGRRIILERGIQIQGEVSFPGFSSTSSWRNSNFTTINFWCDPDPTFMASETTVLAHPGMANALWGRGWESVVPAEKKYLSSAELAYANRFVSFQYRDERDITAPGVLDDMKVAFADLKSRYPNTLVYTNFYPSQAPLDAASLQSFVQYTKPDMVMFDFYPTFNFSNGSRNDWYGAMQRYRTAGLAGYTTDGGVNSGPIPCAQYLAMARRSYGDLLPSESYVRLQQNASWAFGYSFVEAYVYNGTDTWQPSVLFSGPGDNSPTVVFDYVKEANRQSRNLGPALARLVSTDIRMIPACTGTHQETYWDWTWPFEHTRTVDDTLALPDAIRQWARGAQDTGGYADYITGIAPLGNDNGASHVHSDVLIGYFNALLANDGPPTFVDGLTWMIVNGATGTPCAADDGAGDPASKAAERFRIDFDFGVSGFNSLARLSRDTGKVELVTLEHLMGGDGALYRLDLWLDGGTGDLFRFWNSSEPLPSVPEPGAVTLLATAATGSLTYGWRKRK